MGDRFKVDDDVLDFLDTVKLQVDSDAIAFLDSLGGELPDVPDRPEPAERERLPIHSQLRLEPGETPEQFLEPGDGITPSDFARLPLGFTQALVADPINILVGEMSGGSVLERAAKSQLAALTGVERESKPIPRPFDPIRITERLEERGILQEASAIGRSLERIGEITGFLVHFSNASRLLGVHRLPTAKRFLADGTLLSMLSYLGMREQKRQTTGSPHVPLGEATTNFAILFATLPAGALVAKAAVPVVQRLVGRELGKTAREFVQNQAAGAFFEGGGTAAQIVASKTEGTTVERLAQIPDAVRNLTKQDRKEIATAAVEGAIAFTLNGVYSNLFEGVLQGRTERLMKEQMEAAGELIDAYKLGSQETPPRRTPRQEQAERVARNLQATAFVQNIQANVVGRPTRVRPEDLQEMFGLEPQDAVRISRIKTSKEILDLIRDTKIADVQMALAETLGPEVTQEMRWRLDRMTSTEREAYDKQRAEFDAETVAELSQQIPSRKEAIDALRTSRELRDQIEPDFEEVRLEAELSSMEREIAPQGREPGGVTTRAEPPRPTAAREPGPFLRQPSREAPPEPLEPTRGERIRRQGLRPEDLAEMAREGRLTRLTDQQLTGQERALERELEAMERELAPDLREPGDVTTRAAETAPAARGRRPGRERRERIPELRQQQQAAAEQALERTRGEIRRREGVSPEELREMAERGELTRLPGERTLQRPKLPETAVKETTGELAPKPARPAASKAVSGVRRTEAEARQDLARIRKQQPDKQFRLQRVAGQGYRVVESTPFKPPKGEIVDVDNALVRKGDVTDKGIKPHVKSFPTREAAQEAAARLERNNPGRKFEVFEDRNRFYVRQAGEGGGGSDSGSSGGGGGGGQVIALPERAARATAEPSSTAKTTQRPETAQEVTRRAADKRLEARTRQREDLLDEASREPDQVTARIDETVRDLTDTLANAESRARLKGQRAKKGEPTKKDLRARAARTRDEIREQIVLREQTRENQQAAKEGRDPIEIKTVHVFGGGASTVKPQSRKRIQAEVQKELENRVRHEEFMQRMAERYFEERAPESEAAGTTPSVEREASGTKPLPTLKDATARLRKTRFGVPPPARVVGAVERAKQLLGRKATQSPRVEGMEFKLTPEETKRLEALEAGRMDEETRSLVRAMDEADAAAQRRHETIMREMPDTTDFDADLPMIVAWLGAGTVVAGTALDDDEAAVGAVLAALPFFGRKRGKPRRTRTFTLPSGAKVTVSDEPSFTEKWLDRIHKTAPDREPPDLTYKSRRLTDADVRRELDAMQEKWEVLAHGLALVKKPRKYSDSGEIAEPTTGPVSRRIVLQDGDFASWFETFFDTLGHAIARRGPAGQALHQGIQRQIANKRILAGRVYAAFNKLKIDSSMARVQRLRDIVPARERSNLIAVMEEGAKPKSREVRVRALLADWVYNGKAPTKDVPQDIRAEVNQLKRTWDATMGLVAELATSAGLPFHERLMQESGSYGPVIFRDEAFRPTGTARALDPRYNFNLRKADAMRDRIYRNAVERGVTMPSDPKNPDSPRVPITREQVERILDYHSDMRYIGPFGATMEQAYIRKSPFLERHRHLDVREGIEWDPAVLLRTYVESAMNRITMAFEWGSNMERAMALTRLAQQQGWDGARLRDYFDIATGQHPTWNIHRSPRIANELSAFVSFKSLGVAFMPQLISWIRTGELRARIGLNVKPWIVDFTDWGDAILGTFQNRKFLPKSIRDAEAVKERRLIIQESGAALEHEMAQFIELAAGVAPTMATYQPTWIVARALDRFGRRLAIMSGRSGYRQVQLDYEQALKSGKANDIKEAAAHLRELFEQDPVALELALKRTRTPDEHAYLQRVASQVFVNRVHGRNEPVDLPRMASHPWGRHLFKFLLIAIRLTNESARQFDPRRLKKLPKKTTLAWLAALAGTGVGTGAIIKSRRELFGGPDDDVTSLRFLADVADYMGLASPLVLAHDTWAKRYGQGLEKELGADVDEVYELWNLSRRVAVDGTWDPMHLYLLGSLPKPYRNHWWVERKRRAARERIQARSRERRERKK